MSNFKEDLRMAQNDENMLAKILGGSLNPATDYEGLKAYDVSVTYELKTDKMMKDTGNIAMEVEYKGRPSGVKASQADYIVYHLYPGKFYQCPKETLLTELRQGVKIGQFKIVHGGDNQDSKLVLVPMYDFFRIFNQISYV